MKIELRKADSSDIEFLWYLRNQPEVFKFFSSPCEVQWQEHINWIIPVILGKTHRELFVVFLGKKPAGQVRLDWQEDETVIVNISLLKDLQKQGLGAEVLKEAIKKGRELKVKNFIAEIHQDNIVSQKLFEKLGFQLDKQKDIWRTYILNI